MIRVLVLCAFSLLFFSCSNNVIYEKSYDFENDIWRFDNPKQFDFALDDNEIKYDLELDLVHTVNYPFENLYLRIKTDFPDQTSFYDTLSIELIDNQGGWIDHCRGDNCDLKVILEQQIKFRNTGNHSITFEQFNREDDLKGIKTLGFSIRTSEL